MSSKLIGFILLAAGMAFFAIGVDSSRSAADQISNAVSGRYTDRTNWYIVGGSVSALAGAITLLVPPPKMP